jgi:hypothetical protein
MLDADMRAVIEACRLVFAATVNADGSPNLSPKGTVRVWDDHHIYFLDIASPRTRENLQRDSRMELNIVDQASRRGYRFAGRARLHTNDAVYQGATQRVFREEGAEYPVEAVVLVAIERIAPLVSPGYWHVSDEWEMRATWRERRAQLDAAFEAHLRARGPWTQPT